MEFEQILESMSEMEKKYYYSLNEDDKTQYILKKMDEGQVKRTIGNLFTGSIFDKGTRQFVANAKKVTKVAPTSGEEKINGLNDKLEKVNDKIKGTKDAKEIERLNAEKKSIENQINELEPFVKAEKAKIANKAEDDRKERITNGQVNVVLTKGFNTDIAKAILANKDNPKNLAFILNSIDKEGEVYKVDTFDKARLKLLNPKSTFTKDEANSIIKYYTSKGFEFPYSADQLAGANDLSMYNSRTEVFKNVVSEITKDLKKVENLAGDFLKNDQEVASIFEGIDLDDIDGEILYEGITDAIKKPLSAASNLVGNVASAPFDLANSIFDGGKSLGKAAVNGVVNAIKGKHAQNVANKPLKKAQKAQAKAAKQAQKAQDKAVKQAQKAQAKAEIQASENAKLGPIPAFKEVLKNAKNLNDINAAMPKFKEDLETYLKQLGANTDLSELKSLKTYSLKNNKPLDFSEFIDIVNGSSNHQKVKFDDVVEIAKR